MPSHQEKVPTRARRSPPLVSDFRQLPDRDPSAFGQHTTSSVLPALSKNRYSRFFRRSTVPLHGIEASFDLPDPRETHMTRARHHRNPKDAQLYSRQHPNPPVRRIRQQPRQRPSRQQRRKSPHAFSNRVFGILPPNHAPAQASEGIRSLSGRPMMHFSMHHNFQPIPAHQVHGSLPP